ncbi:MAG: DUF2017 domain-containing protein [Actinobacteria bacterium]|nr:DUF2017 domain-containing protein [Actinomycetota bacterium]MBU1494316.1 DUF2017 domain-containing protein [Actinomycetota bacterium]MBU1866642.1 DUF2017 domain-containing protein [Actinomycetota bacterium]
MYPFMNSGGHIAVLLAPAEREVLRAVPILLRNRSADPGDPAWARLRAVGHLDDPDAADRFGDLTAGMLESALTGDRDRLEETLEDDLLDPADAECWLRAIGEARLKVAARLGIEEDGWEGEAVEAELVEITVLRMLGFLQESLVAVLSERI